MTTDDRLLFNPFDPAFRADPYPFYDRLREQAPVYVAPFGFVVLTRYDDVARTLRSNEFSRDVEANAARRASDAVRCAEREARTRREAAKTILNLDPPDHTRLRRLVSQGVHADGDRAAAAAGRSSWSTTCSTAPPSAARSSSSTTSPSPCRSR